MIKELLLLFFAVVVVTEAYPEPLGEYADQPENVAVPIQGENDDLSADESAWRGNWGYGRGGYGWGKRYGGGGWGGGWGGHSGWGGYKGWRKSYYW